MDHKVYEGIGLALKGSEYTDDLEEVLRRYFKSPSNSKMLGEFRIKGLENFVFPLNKVVFPKEDGKAPKHLHQLLLDYWTIPHEEDVTDQILQDFYLLDNTKTAKLKNVLTGTKPNEKLLEFAIDKASIEKNDILNYFKLEPCMYSSVLRKIKVIALDNIIIILPYFYDENCSHVQHQLMEFLLLNSIIHSTYFEEFYNEADKFHDIWRRYLGLLEILSVNLHVPSEYKKFINASLYNYLKENNQIVANYPEIFKYTSFRLLFSNHKIQKLYNYDMRSKKFCSRTLENIDVGIPNNYEEILAKIDELYPFCNENEKAFCDFIIFMITLHHNDFQKAVLYGENLLYDEALLEKIKAFNSHYGVLDLQVNCEILRLDNNHVKGKIAWGLLDCYVQLQQFDRGHALLLTGEVFPLPLLKLYKNRATLARNYRWNDLSKEIYKVLLPLEQKELLNILSCIPTEMEKACTLLEENKVELPIPVLQSLMIFGKSLNKAETPQLENLYPLIVLARLLFGTNKKYEWEEHEAGIILEEDLRLLMEFQLQMEIALYNDDLLVLGSDKIGSHQTKYYSQKLYKDFSQRLTQMIKVLIVEKEFVLAEFFIDIFKKYFYSFEELLQFETFFTQLMSSKSKSMELSVVKKLQEAIQATQSIEQVNQYEKDRLTNQINYIQQIYTQVGETAYYFSKTMKDEVIFSVLKDKLSETDLDLIADHLQNRWEEDFKKYHISSHSISRVRENLLQDFGDSFFKLDEKTQEFLVSGIVTYEELAPIPASAQIDYSGPIIPLSKAVEHELQTKIYLPYRDSFNNRVNGDFKRIPSSIINKREKRLCKDHEMTLGTFRFIAGTSIDGTIVNRYENNHFIYFCKGIFNFTTEQELRKFVCNDLVVLIEKLRKNYRNKAAHTAYLDKVKAKECLELVAQTKKIMHLLATRYK